MTYFKYINNILYFNVQKKLTQCNLSELKHLPLKTYGAIKPIYMQINQLDK